MCRTIGRTANIKADGERERHEQNLPGREQSRERPAAPVIGEAALSLVVRARDAPDWGETPALCREPG
jgi:hypothetical protein